MMGTKDSFQTSVPVFVKYTVHESNVETFEDEIIGKNNENEIENYILTGLHTCGNEFLYRNKVSNKVSIFNFF